jgi:hypothetical protein
MPKKFSVATWNVEHFHNETIRVKRIAEFINGQHGGPPNVPDVFVLFEVEGKEVFQEFMTQFPDHRFHLTEGKQTQELFIGVHRNFQSFTTVRLEFKVMRDSLRPGLLLTLNADGIYYSLLFLHLKSGENTEDHGLRDSALQSAFNLKKALDEAAGGQHNYIFAGDLNTMGIDDPVPYSKTLDFSSRDEIDRIAKWARRKDMKLITKDKTLVNGQPLEVSWYNGSSGYVPTNLDHIVVSEHMDIRDHTGKKGNASLFGWSRLPQNQWNQWFSDFSDHCLLYFEVW